MNQTSMLYLDQKNMTNSVLSMGGQRGGGTNGVGRGTKGDGRGTNKGGGQRGKGRGTKGEGDKQGTSVPGCIPHYH